MSNLLIRKLEPLTRLTVDDRETLRALCHRTAHFAARDDFIKDGEDPHYVNVVLEGWACRYKQLQDGRRQIISLFLPGDMCDPMVFMLAEMSHSLASVTPVSVARITRDEMLSMLSRSPNIENALWLDSLRTAEIQREWTINLGRRTAVERMAHLFCELPLRLKSVGLSNGLECELPLTQSDLADALGLSAVHISRTLQELRGAGLVELKGKRLKIHDQAALRDLAMFDPSYLHLPDAGSPQR